MFYDETAAHIKQVDPTHLVSTGALAPFQSFQFGVDGYRDAHSGPDIDLVSVHEYDYASSGGQSVVSQQFDVARDAAAQLGKPVYVGEAGVSLSSGCMTAEQRADVLRQKFDAYLGAGSSGVLYWVVLGPPNNPGSVCDEQFGNRDPMLGGPVMHMIGDYR
jgi:endo-1,4-beta-mannosidase